MAGMYKVDDSCREPCLW